MLGRSGFLAAATLALGLSSALGNLGCAGAVDVTRTFTPKAASRVSRDALQPVAILRGEERIPLPAGTRVEADRVLVPSRTVRGVGKPAQAFELQPSDGIEMHGKLEPGSAIPGGGRVESTRATGWLGAGLVVFALSYAPTLYVGLSSNDPYDRALQVPFAGPWMDFLSRPACVPPTLPAAVAATAASYDLCTSEKIARGALITSGVVQDLAAVFVLVGLPASTRIVGDADRGVALVPTPGGAKLVGTF